MAVEESRTPIRRRTRSRFPTVRLVPLDTEVFLGPTVPSSSSPPSRPPNAPLHCSPTPLVAPRATQLQHRNSGAMCLRGAVPLISLLYLDGNRSGERELAVHVGHLRQANEEHCQVTMPNPALPLACYSMASAADARVQHHQDIRLVLRLLSAVRPSTTQLHVRSGGILADVQRGERGTKYLLRNHRLC
jgi:hypothetical protein